MSSLERIIERLKKQKDADRRLNHLEPKVDDRDLPKLDDGAQQREDEDLERGAVLIGGIEPGEGQGSPKPGDLVFLQFTIFDLSGEILLSTRPECGGPGNPIPYVLAKGSARPLRGVELALANMKLKERCMLQLKPEYAYLHPECKIDPPPGLRKDDPVKMDVQLYAWESAVKAHPVGADGATKLIVAEGTGWETPRPPFKVELEVSARWAAPSGGAESSVAPYFPGGGDSTAPKLSCNLGAGALPPALEAAVGSMMRGERAKVLCPVGIASGGGMIPAPPASLAEGDPRFAALRYVEFDVTLVDFSQVRDLTGDGGATKCTLRKGRGDFPADCPLEDTTLQARIRVRRAQTALNGSNGSTSGETGDRDASEPANWLVLPGADASGKVEVDTGMGSLPEPVESALRLMLRDELALVTSDWAHSYGGREGDAPAGLPSGSDLEFEVELLDFQAEVNHHELGADDKLDKADTWREQGNILFKQGKYLLARQKYHKAMKCAGQALDLETQEQFDRAKRAKVSCLLNLAACAQKQEAYGEAITWCDKAINEDSEHAKAHFRRGQAQAALAEYAAAKEDFEAARRLDPSISDLVDKELARMVAQAKVAAQKQRRQISGFFNGK